MKIAAFNVENLFDRAKAFNEEGSEGTDAVQQAARLNVLFEKSTYSAADKARMIELAEELELNRYNEGPLALIRQIRGKIFRRPNAGGIQVVANGRDDWIGWVELKTAPVNETAVLNTGRVIRDVDADILAVIEAEDRVSLKRFTEFVSEKVNEELPAAQHTTPYTSVMLIDGNDRRGIDVGLMTKDGYDIGTVQSHIHDTSNGRQVYSRDCPEYAVTTPQGETIWILPNHFKSKFGGDNQTSRDKRELQAKTTAEIYERLRSEGEDLIVVLGDLNDRPDSNPLKPLLKDTDLADVSELPFFQAEFRANNGNKGIGTYALGNDNQKIDYLLLSPALTTRATAAGLFRKGAWPGKQPPRWDVYPQLQREVHVASDHHVIWVEID